MIAVTHFNATTHALIDHVRARGRQKNRVGQPGDFDISPKIIGHSALAQWMETDTSLWYLQYVCGVVDEDVASEFILP